MDVSLSPDLAWGKQFERTAAQVFIEKVYPGAQLIQQQMTADVDWAVVSEDGTLVAFVEVKARRVPSTRYDSTIVAWRKHDCGRFNLVFHKVPTHCIVVFTDAFGTFGLHQRPDDKEEITRADRGIPVTHAVYDHSRLTWHPDLAAKMTLPEA